MTFIKEKIKGDFPIFKAQVRDDKPLTYLDSAATTQKPAVVIDAEAEFYRNEYGTVRRGIYHLSAIATQKYEAVRKKVSSFINAAFVEEVIYTRGTTESINIVSRCYGEKFLGNGDEILLTEFEHHSDMVPWFILQESIGCKIGYIKSTSDWRIDMADYRSRLSPRTKLVAVSGMSNVLGCITDLEEICALAHKVGAKVLVDGAQLVPHLGIDVRKIDCDFLAFSSHKMLGPTGVGILYVKRELAELMPPFLGGGDMIESVRYDGFVPNELPYKFEAGTPNIAGVIGFGEAISYLQSLGLDNIIKHEEETTEYALERLLGTDGVMLYGPKTPDKRGALFSFNYKDIHSHDVASILDFSNIAVRAGHHCAQPLMKNLEVISTVRASFYVYNMKEEIDVLLDSLKQCERFLKNAVR